MKNNIVSGNSVESFEKFEFSVIETARRLAESTTGSGSQYETETEMAEWLEWRIFEGWSDSVIGAFAQYENSVRNMANTALNMWKLRKK